MALDIKSLQAQLAALQAENAALSAKVNKEVVIEYGVSERGTFTLTYKKGKPLAGSRKTWDRLKNALPGLYTFMDENASKADAAAKHFATLPKKTRKPRVVKAVATP